MTSLRDKKPIGGPRWVEHYQHHFVLAIQNWELNKQEDRQSNTKTISLRKR